MVTLPTLSERRNLGMIFNPYLFITTFASLYSFLIK